MKCSVSLEKGMAPGSIVFFYVFGFYEDLWVILRPRRGRSRFENSFIWNLKFSLMAKNVGSVASLH